MSDYDFPELPSDDELGISDDDQEQYAQEGPPAPSRDEPALSPESRAERKLAKDSAKAEMKASAAAGRAYVGAEGPRRRWRGPATLVVLLALGWVSSSRTGLPSPAPANAPATEFSSARAMATLVELAREPHAPGSPEHVRVRGFIVERLLELGLTPEIQTTTSVAQRGGYARAATVRNIIARIPGTDPSGTVLITAHYDSREIAVGAADDGSGVVTILESVRALLEDPPLENDIVVLITDAEELGLLGARAFVAEHSLMADVDLVLSFEMRGSGGPSIMFETNDENGWVVRALKEFDPSPATNSLSYEVYRRMPNGTDYTAFKDVGVQGLNFAAIDNAHVYHQAYDTPDNLSESTLQHHGLHALSALQYFGQADLSEVNAPNVVYFSLPGAGLVIYSAVWVNGISLLLLVLFAAFFWMARRNGARLLGAAAGLGIAVTAAAASWFAATTLLGWLPTIHEEIGSLPGSIYHSEGWYILVIAFVAFAVVTALTAATRRWVSLVEVMLGAFLVPLGAAIALGVVAPLGAMNIQLPLAAALLAGIAMASLGSRADSTVGWVAALLLAAPVFFILQWVVEILWLALTLSLGGVIAVVITFGVLLCLPALEGLRHPNSWWAPLSASALACACLGMGWLSARPNAERPAPSTLVYAYEHGSGAALWATSPTEEGRDLAATAWAESSASGPFDQSRDLEGFGYRSGVVPVRTASVVSAAPPSVMLLGDSVIDGTRHVTMRVRSEIGAEMLAFRFNGGTRAHSINGKPLDNPETIVGMDHWGEPDGSVELELTLPPLEAIDVTVIEHLLRPEELLGAEPFERPDGLAPDIVWMSDRAMFRYSVAAFVDPRHAIVQPVQVDLPGLGYGAAGLEAPEGDTPDGTRDATDITPWVPTDTVTGTPPVADFLIANRMLGNTLGAPRDTITIGDEAWP